MGAARRTWRREIPRVAIGAVQWRCTDLGIRGAPQRERQNPEHFLAAHKPGFCPGFLCFRATIRYRRIVQPRDTPHRFSSVRNVAKPSIGPSNANSSTVSIEPAV